MFPARGRISLVRKRGDGPLVRGGLRVRIRVPPGAAGGRLPVPARLAGVALVPGVLVPGVLVPGVLVPGPVCVPEGGVALILIGLSGATWRAVPLAWVVLAWVVLLGVSVLAAIGLVRMGLGAVFLVTRSLVTVPRPGIASGARRTRGRLLSREGLISRHAAALAARLGVFVTPVTLLRPTAPALVILGLIILGLIILALVIALIILALVTLLGRASIVVSVTGIGPAVITLAGAVVPRTGAVILARSVVLPARVRALGIGRLRIRRLGIRRLGVRRRRIRGLGIRRGWITPVTLLGTGLTGK